MKYLLVFLLGFGFNSALRTYYSYLWWSAEAKVTKEEINKSIDKTGHMQVVNDKIGIQDNIKYILATPSYTFRNWEVMYP